MKIINIKIITAPGDIHSPPPLPSLAMASITSYLRSNGYNIEQMDLRYCLPQRALYKFYDCLDDIPRVKEFMLTGSDSYFNKIAKRIVVKVGLDRSNIVLFSTPEACQRTAALLLILAKYIKRLNKQIITVFGGEQEQIPYIYNSFSFLNQAGVVDFLVRGYGEVPLVKLIEALNTGSRDFSQIPGLVYCDGNDKVCVNPYNRQWCFPKPDFTGLNLKDYYFSRTHSYRLLDLPSKRYFKDSFILPVSFIQGCPNQCAFCDNYFDNPLYKFETLPPKQAADLVEDLSFKYNTKFFHFLNTELNITPQYVNEFCDEILRKNLNILWTDCVNFKGLDRQTIEKMKKAGAIRLVFGGESGSQKILDYVGKGFTLSHASDCLRWSHEAGIWNHVNFISGLPYENNEDIKNTLNFLYENDNFIDEIDVNVFILRGNSLSPMSKWPEKYGLTNIRREDEGFLSKTVFAPSYNPLFEQFNYKFDEANGLKWEEKKKYALYSYKKVMEAYGHKFMFHCLGFHERIFVLLFLYQICRKKELVRKHFERYRKKNVPKFNNLHRVIKKIKNTLF